MGLAGLCGQYDGQVRREIKSSIQRGGHLFITLHLPEVLCYDNGRSQLDLRQWQLLQTVTTHVTA